MASRRNWWRGLLGSPHPTASTTPPAAANFEQLVFLATKSKEYLAQQAEGLEQRRQNAGVLVTLLLALLTLFLGQTLPPWSLWLKALSLVPVMVFGMWAVVNFLRVMSGGISLADGLAPNQFSSLINQPYDQVLLVEIATNTLAFKQNERLLHKAQKPYRNAVLLTILTFLWACVVLLGTKFYVPPVSSPLPQYIPAMSASPKTEYSLPAIDPKSLVRIDDGFSIFSRKASKHRSKFSLFFKKKVDKPSPGPGNKE